MKAFVLALCLVAVVASIAFLIWPNVGQQLVGPTPTPGDIRGSVFNGLPRGLQ